MLEFSITHNALYLRRGGSSLQQRVGEILDLQQVLNLNNVMIMKGVDRVRVAKGATLFLIGYRRALLSTVALFLGFALLLLGLPVTKLLLHYHYTVPSLSETEATVGLPMYQEVDYHQLLPDDRSMCDYSEGRWVLKEEGSQPPYSGPKCSPWLAEMWACRLDNDRSSFDYENYRWQPVNCDLPPFNAHAFLHRLRNKTVAFVGDSLGRQQFQSLMCLVTGGKNSTDLVVEDVGPEYGFVLALKSRRPDGWSYRFPLTNTTILFYWSASLADLTPLVTDINSSRPDMAMHIDRPPSFLRDNLHRFHVIIVNSGHHWNEAKMKKNRWKIHVDGAALVPNHPFFNSLPAAYNFSLHSSLNWLDRQLDSHHQVAFLQSLSPRHFFHGDWDSGGRCDNTKLKGTQRVLRGPLVDDVAESAIRGTQINLLNITLLSQYRDEAHVSKYSSKFKNGTQDCLHWCLPGVPDTWNQILYAMLLREQALSSLDRWVS